MAYVLGIDPGSSGALALYDNVSRQIVGDIIDIPTWYQVVSKKKRKRVNAMAVADLLETFEMMGAELIVMEAVGGYGKQSGVGAFAFGYTVGILYMACFYSGIPIETVPPQIWKQMLNVPGKSKADASAILARADELFPAQRNAFRGPKDGPKLDRAEAAMIAKYGGDYILPNYKPRSDTERRLGYANADTGG